ncbi:MAG: hypothetical protein R2764_02340 [Bacteroidales bacterium]
MRLRQRYYSFIKTIPVRVYPNPVNGGRLVLPLKIRSITITLNSNVSGLMGKQVYETVVITGKRKLVPMLTTGRKGCIWWWFMEGGGRWER